jgi:hypothetical protein
MADITFASLSDLTVSAALHQELGLKLADRASLLGHPALWNLGSIAGSGSNVRKAGIAGFGSDKMAAIADGSAVTSTALTNANVSVTVARQALSRSPTDLATMTWAFPSAGALVDALSTDMVVAARRRFQAMLCDVTDGFTTVVGASGVDFSVTNWFSAMGALQAVSAPGPWLSVLAPQQLTDLQTSLRSETGALQFIPATAEMLAIKGQGYAGSFLGVDIFVSSEVPTANAGADRAGCIISYGAVAYAEGTPVPVVGAGGLVLPAGTSIYVEIQRNAASALTNVVGNYYVGLAVAQDLLGVSVITDA